MNVFVYEKLDTFDFFKLIFGNYFNKNINKTCFLYRYLCFR